MRRLKRLEATTPVNTVSVPIAQTDVEQGQPVDIAGAYVGGYLYYPYRFKRMVVEDGVELSRYETRVLRSDGVSLGYGYKPAPKGTPQEDRVLALDDGTDITRVPVASTTRQSFSLAGIERFMAARRRGESAVSASPGKVLARVEAYLRAAATLPYPEDYSLLSLCVVASYCQRVFRAVPIVLIVGPAGSGKSQLAAAMAELGCNGVVLSGQTSAATLAREIDRTGGLVVLDDLERVSPLAGRRRADDLTQLLKLGYKQSTSRKALTAWTGRGGRVETLDLYGVKVVTNTTGADEILLSRMLVVQSAPFSSSDTSNVELDIEEVQALKDDLHSLALEQVGLVAQTYQASPSARTRLEEISAPLKTLAAVLADSDSEFPARLQASLVRRARAETLPADPVARVRLALDAILEQGFTHTFCLFHLQLELSLQECGRWQTEPENDNPQAKWVGRILYEHNWVDPDFVSRRPRLLGVQTKVYAFAESSDEQQPAPEALGFCLSMQCQDCRYLTVCPLSAKKLKRFSNDL